MAIARGERRVAAGEPKVWFTSTESFAKVLSAGNRELLRIIAFVPRPDYRAVAAELGMPVGSIGPTRGRCLAKLRALLADDPEGSPR